MAKNNQATRDAETISALYAGTAGLTVFWLTIIVKGVVSGVKSALNFYPDVGPLLGMFLVGFLTFIATYYLVVRIMSEQKKSVLTKHERTASILFVVSTVVIFIMTFPPIFEPIVDLFK